MKKCGLVDALLSLNLFVLFKSKEHLKLFVNCMNLKHNDIKFTFEAEDLICFFIHRCQNYRKDKRFVTLIFRKATFSGDFTNYDSFIFDTCNVGLAHTPLFGCL